MTEVKEERSLQ